MGLERQKPDHKTPRRKTRRQTKRMAMKALTTARSAADGELINISTARAQHDDARFVPRSHFSEAISLTGRKTLPCFGRCLSQKSCSVIRGDQEGVRRTGLLLSVAGSGRPTTPSSRKSCRPKATTGLQSSLVWLTQPYAD